MFDPALTDPHGQLDILCEGCGHVAAAGRAHARQIVGAVVGVVGHDDCARPQTVFDQIEDIRIERLGAVEQHEIDRIGQIGAQRLERVALADLDQVVEVAGCEIVPGANKASILFRLRSDEWRANSSLLRDILADRTRPPLERLRVLVHAFIRSECEEAAVREALPKASDAVRATAGDLITTTMSTVGKDFSESPRSPAEIESYADAMADMFCAYLRSLGKR